MLTISGHAWLPGDTNCYDDNICVCERFLKTIVCGKIASDSGFGADVVQVRGDAGEGYFDDAGVSLFAIGNWEEVGL